jgi:hypothetical protein
MKAKNEPRINLAVMLIGILTIGYSQPAHAQPYGFSMRSLGDTTEIMRTDLATNERMHFLTLFGQVSPVFWDPSQQWLFHIDDNRLIGTKILDTTITTILGMNIQDARVVAKVVGQNRYIMQWELDIGGTESSVSQMLEASTLASVDSFSIEVAGAYPTFLSSDETTLYIVVNDTLSFDQYLEAYSLANRSVLWRRKLYDIGPPTINKLVNTGKNGKALIGYDYPTATIADGHFLVYDPSTGQSTSPSAFPFRSKGFLSSNARQIIAQRVDLDTTAQGQGEMQTGDVWTFDAASGAILQKLTFPQGGDVFVFDADTLHFYYHVNSTDAWIKGGLARDPALKGGVFNPTGTSNISVKVKPSVSFSGNDTLRSLTATLRWQARYPITLGSISSPVYGITKCDSVITSGGYKYQKFQLTSPVAVNWTANAEYELFTVAVNGSAGVEDFTLTNALSGGQWCVDIDYLDKTDSIFYQPVATCTGLAWQNKTDNAGATFHNGSRHLAKTSSKLHEVYNSGGEILYRRKDLAGSWEITQRISGDPTSLNNDPSIIVAHDGSVHAVWQQQLGATNFALCYNRSTDGGTTWGSPAVLAPNVSIIQDQWNIYPVIAEYGTSQLVVVWCSGSGYTTGLQYDISSDLGQNWGGVTALSSSGNTTWFPSLVSGSGYLMLIYDGRSNGVFSRIYNGSWQPVVSVSNSDGMLFDRYSSVSVDDQSKPIAAWCAQSYNHIEYTIMYRSGNTDGSWGSGFVEFAVDSTGIHDLYPSITYLSRNGVYGIDIIYAASNNKIKVNKSISGYWPPPVVLSTSGQWPNTSIANQTTSPGYPVRVWTDQVGSPYQVSLQSDGNYSFQKAQALAASTADLHRRIVVESQRTRSAIWFDLAPLKVVTTANDTVVIPFKTLDMSKPFTATLTNAWDYLGSDLVTLPTNARSLIVDTDIRSQARQDSLGNTGLNVFTSSSFRFDGVKASQTVPLLSNQAGTVRSER